MTGNGHSVMVWGIVPAAGLSRRMGFPKQTTRMGGATMVATVVNRMIESGVAGVVVVTRSKLLASLGLPRDKQIATAINNDEKSEMLDSIKIGLSMLSKPPRHTSIDEERVTLGSRVRSHIRHTEGAGAFDCPPKPGDGIMVVPADMPGITLGTYNCCITAFAGDYNRIVIAMHEGKRGHPIIFPFSMRVELANLHDGLRGLARLFPDLVQFIETTDPGTQSDIDTPGELRLW